MDATPVGSPLTRPREATHTSTSTISLKGSPRQRVLKTKHRIKHACTYCQRRKRRCNGADPCQSCLDENVVCSYNAPSLRQVDSDMLFQRMKDIDAKLELLLSQKDRSSVSIEGSENNTVNIRDSMESVWSLQEIQSHFSTADSSPHSWPTTQRLIQRLRETVIHDEQPRGIYACSGVLPKADSQYKRMCLTSFVKHLYVLHPFLDVRYLTRLADSDEDSDADSVGTDETFENTRTDDAIVRLVYALGESCHESNLQGSNLAMRQQSARHRNPSISETRLSDDQSWYGDRSYHNRLATTTEARRKPPVQHFTRICEMMNPHAGDNSTKWLQLCLLSCLYTSHTGQLEEALQWLRAASDVVRNLIQQYSLPLKRYEDWYENGLHDSQQWHPAVKDGSFHSVILAAWTCIELERELHGPHGLASDGIWSLQDILPWPYQIPGADQYDKLVRVPGSTYGQLSSFDILLGYTAKIWLYKQMGRIIADVSHKSRHCGIRDTKVFTMLKDHEAVFDTWRQSLPAVLQWGNGEPGSQNPVSAHLRSRYFEALFILKRPYLDYVLHVLPTSCQDDYTSFKDCAPASKWTDDGPLDFGSSLSHDTVLAGAKAAVTAAVRHIALHDEGSPQCFMINIASFIRGRVEKVLTLSVIHFYANLPEILAEFTLRTLVEDLIVFIQQHQTALPACRMEQCLLTALHKLICQ